MTKKGVLTNSIVHMITHVVLQSVIHIFIL